MSGTLVLSAAHSANEAWQELYAAMIKKEFRSPEEVQKLVQLLSVATEENQEKRRDDVEKALRDKEAEKGLLTHITSGNFLLLKQKLEEITELKAPSPDQEERAGVVSLENSHIFGELLKTLSRISAELSIFWWTLLGNSEKRHTKQLGDLEASVVISEQNIPETEIDSVPCDEFAAENDYLYIVKFIVDAVIPVIEACFEVLISRCDESIQLCKERL